MATTIPQPSGAAEAGGTVQEIELAVGGMTCASCANPVERKLNKLDDVNATVNYATEKGKGLRTNLFWAFAYNTAAIPLAALGLLNP